MSDPAPPRLPEPVPVSESPPALAPLLRGLSALFWGLPVALIICVQTAKGDWLRPLGILPPLGATGLLWYGLHLLGAFQPAERTWRAALDRAELCAVVCFGLSPFLFWWNRLPNETFYLLAVELLVAGGLLLLLLVNRVLLHLATLLHDETLCLETRLFTTINHYFLLVALLLLLASLVLMRLQGTPHRLVDFFIALNRSTLWMELFLILLPLATTMALLWKLKEVVLSRICAARD